MKIIMIINKEGFPLIRTTAMSTHDAWMSFFKRGHGDGLIPPSGVCLSDAIKGYRTIGYKTVEFELSNPREVRNKWNNFKRCFTDQHDDNNEDTKNEQNKKNKRGAYKLVWDPCALEKNEDEE